MHRLTKPVSRCQGSAPLGVCKQSRRLSQAGPRGPVDRGTYRHLRAMDQELALCKRILGGFTCYIDCASA